MIELQKKNAHIAFTTPSVIGGEGGYVDLSNYYTRDEVDQAIAAIPEVDLNNYYDKNEVDTKIDEIELTPGPAGKDGYTPVKGIDYFDGKDYVLTDADKQEIANMIDVPSSGGGSSSGGSGWIFTMDTYDYNLYNATEIYIRIRETHSMRYDEMSSYVVLGALEPECLWLYTNCPFSFTPHKRVENDTTSFARWYYDGNGIQIDCNYDYQIMTIAYKMA